MYAPPLRATAPPFLTSFAIFESISLFSTEQGPAISIKLSPPIKCPFILIIVSDFLNSLLTNLYALLIFTISTKSLISLKFSFLKLFGIYSIAYFIFSPSNKVKYFILFLSKNSSIFLDKLLSFNSIYIIPLF